MEEQIRKLREFFKTGNTLGYDFRIKQLSSLKEKIEQYEEDILIALDLDMKKPSYEAYTSELGLVYREINDAMENLKDWMENEKVQTPIYLKPANSYIRPMPKGLVFIISPWNYPFLLTFSPLVASIAAGNCSLVKVSSKSYYSSRLIEKIIKEAFSEDYIKPLMGPGERAEKVLKDYDFDHVFFTGSKKIGRRIGEICGRKLIPASLELGGKSPAIVDETADIDLAAKKISWGKFLNLGQTCIAPDYVIVKKSVKEEFIKSAIKHIEKFYGRDIGASEDYGRIINKEAYKRLESLMDSRDRDWAFSGENREEDLFIHPSIVEVDLSDRLMEEEIFGPIMPIIVYEENMDLIDIISKNPNPLALYLFTEDDQLIEYIINGVAFGGGCINDTISHMANLNLPFGGVRQSGIGSYHSYYGFKTFSNFKPILEVRKNIDIDIKYPPYNRRKSRISKFMLKN